MSKRSWITGLFVVAAVVSGCAGAEESDSGGDPAASVEEGPEVSRVTLTELGARRLGIATQPVEQGPGGTGLAIPFAAVVYGSDGAAWTFTNPEGLTYVRAPITISTIDGDRAVLSAGPPVGTAVVTVGALELVGAEAGLGA
jgi:hypothetical protein